MNKLRCVIVDDEPVARQGLINMLGNYPTVEVVGEAFNTESLALVMNQMKPDLVFMDIMLRNENVLDMLKELAFESQIIFTTAFAEYALRGYDFRALDYLLKPISPEQLERALNRAYKTATVNNKDSDNIYLRINGKYHRIFYRDILYLEGMENYVVIQTTAKRLICKGTMQWFVANLPTEHFLRVHRSYIVNKNRVDMIDKLNLVIGEFLVPISRENRQRVYGALIPDFKGEI